MHNVGQIMEINLSTFTFVNCHLHSKNFRELLAWDFTQFSCFNQIDSLLLVSSVKTTTDYMERRGYVAIISLLNGIITSMTCTTEGHRGRDCMVVGFTTTCAINDYHHYRSEYESCAWRSVLDFHVPMVNLLISLFLW
jgi:hypothetical protein